VSASEEVSVVVTILSKTDRKPTLGGKCLEEWQQWPFTGLGGESQAARARPPGFFPCPKGRRLKAVLDKSDLLSDYLTSVKQPAKECSDLISSSLDPIRTGPDVADLRSGRAPKGRFFLNDISTDIRILPEFIASGSSPTAQLELRTSVVTVPRAC
jgi:hypothetical protein